MNIRIFARILYAVELSAWTMINAEERAVFAPTDRAARFWQGVGRTGETLEAFVDRMSARLGIDMSACLIDRAYADAGR